MHEVLYKIQLNIVWFTFENFSMNTFGNNLIDITSYNVLGHKTPVSINDLTTINL